MVDQPTGLNGRKVELLAALMVRGRVIPRVSLRLRPGITVANSDFTV